MLKDLPTQTEWVHKNPDYGVNQIKAAENVYATIQALKDAELVPEGLGTLVNSDVFQLRRGLCLPSSTATCINKVADARAIGDEDGLLTVADMYTTLMPFHGYKNPDQTADLPKGWLTFTTDGFFYYHALSAFSKAVGVEAQPIQGFDSVADLGTDVDRGHAFAVSLNNDFVIEQTLKNHPELVDRQNGHASILVEGKSGLKFHQFEHSRHVVAIIGRRGDVYQVFDPFQLPQVGPDEGTLFLPADVIDTYLTYQTSKPTQAIFFSNGQPNSSVEQFGYNHVVPDRVVANIRDYLGTKLQIQ